MYMCARGITKSGMLVVMHMCARGITKSGMLVVMYMCARGITKSGMLVVMYMCARGITKSGMLGVMYMCARGITKSGMLVVIHMCARGIHFASVSTILRLDLGTFLTVLYFFSPFYNNHYWQYDTRLSLSSQTNIKQRNTTDSRPLMIRPLTVLFVMNSESVNLVKTFVFRERK